MRNPTLHINNQVIQFIGDCHLGRKFVTNVPLERRGEYEDFQYAEFERLLNISAEYHIQVGDLFDKAKVDESDILRTYNLVRNFKGKQLIILAGNHDVFKNTTDVSSFELFAELVKGLPNVHIVQTVMTIQLGAEKISLVGWEFDKTLVQKLPVDTDILVCHMDSVSYGDEHNVIPFSELSDIGVRLVYNGHEHKPSEKRIAGVEYIGTGSLLPYSHAEDDEDGIYLTFFDLDALDNYVAEAGYGCFLNNHVRIYTDTPELIPEMGCLSLQVNKAKQVAEDEIQPEHVEVEEWSLEHLGKLSGERTGLDAVKVRSVLNEILEAEQS